MKCKQLNIKHQLMVIVVLLLGYYLFIQWTKTQDDVVTESINTPIPVKVRKTTLKITNSKPKWRISKKQTAKIVAMFKNVPKITLVYRTTSTKRLLRFLFCTALRTTTLYWSGYYGNIALILDKESPKDRELQKRITKYQENIGLKFEFVYEATNKKINGYAQQLYSTFIMDEYFKTPIIALTDTDAKFITPVTLENIFTGTKLKAKGVHSRWRTDKYFEPWHTSLQQLLGFPMVADSMTYFPVYIWRDTLTNCRKHILKHTKSKNINEALSKVGRRTSPVSIIMSYAFHFEKDRYDWHIDIKDDNLTNYNKQYRPIGHKLLSKDITPDIHVQLHDKHYHKPNVSNIVNKIAFCAAVKDTTVKLHPQTIQMCDQYRHVEPWILFEFEYCLSTILDHKKTWCNNNFELCQSLLINHYARANHYVNLGIYNYDLKRVAAVEKMAAEHGVQCRNFWIDDYHKYT